jgi:excisionase family DNA binding protein
VDALLKAPAVAAQLAVSRRTIERLAAAGVLPAVRLGRAVRYRESDVARVIKIGGVPATAHAEKGSRS